MILLAAIAPYLTIVSAWNDQFRVQDCNERFLTHFHKSIYDKCVQNNDRDAAASAGYIVDQFRPYSYNCFNKAWPMVKGPATFEPTARLLQGQLQGAWNQLMLVQGPRIQKRAGSFASVVGVLGQADTALLQGVGHTSSRQVLDSAAKKIAKDDFALNRIASNLDMAPVKPAHQDDLALKPPSSGRTAPASQAVPSRVDRELNAKLESAIQAQLFRVYGQTPLTGAGEATLRSSLLPYTEELSLIMRKSLDQKTSMKLSHLKGAEKSQFIEGQSAYRLKEGQKIISGLTKVDSDTLKSLMAIFKVEEKGRFVSQNWDNWPTKAHKDVGVSNFESNWIASAQKREKDLEARILESVVIEAKKTDTDLTTFFAPNNMKTFAEQKGERLINDHMKGTRSLSKPIPREPDAAPAPGILPEVNPEPAMVHPEDGVPPRQISGNDEPATRGVGVRQPWSVKKKVFVIGGSILAASGLAILIGFLAAAAAN